MFIASQLSRRVVDYLTFCQWPSLSFSKLFSSTFWLLDIYLTFYYQKYVGHYPPAEMYWLNYMSQVGRQEFLRCTKLKASVVPSLMLPFWSHDVDIRRRACSTFKVLLKQDIRKTAGASVSAYHLCTIALQCNAVFETKLMCKECSVLIKKEELEKGKIHHWNLHWAVWREVHPAGGAKTLGFEIFNEIIIIILSESGVGTDQRQNTCIPIVIVTILM